MTPLRTSSAPEFAAPRGEPQATTLLAVDPGHELSAYVVYDRESGRPTAFEKVDNYALLNEIAAWCPMSLVIEQVACMGMAVGAEVFETVFWSGRFCQAVQDRGGKWHRIKRHQIKQHLCGNQRAKDANIRAALLDRYGPGKEIAIGRKAAPGPLYGMSGDCWQALAVAVVWSDLHCSDVGNIVESGHEQPQSKGR